MLGRTIKGASRFTYVSLIPAPFPDARPIRLKTTARPGGFPLRGVVRGAALLPVACLLPSSCLAVAAAAVRAGRCRRRMKLLSRDFAIAIRPTMLASNA